MCTCGTGAKNPVFYAICLFLGLTLLLGVTFVRGWLLHTLQRQHTSAPRIVSVKLPAAILGVICLVQVVILVAGLPSIGSAPRSPLPTASISRQYTSAPLLATAADTDDWIFFLAAIGPNFAVWPALSSASPAPQSCSGSYLRPARPLSSDDGRSRSSSKASSLRTMLNPQLVADFRGVVSTKNNLPALFTHSHDSQSICHVNVAEGQRHI